MKLSDIEQEVLRHATAERRRWQQIAGLLMEVERGALWRSSAPSFTAWLSSLARRADLEESVLWRCLKAGRIYVELTGSERLEDAAVSAEALELADKIRRHAPRPVAREVLSRTLDGQIGRGELRKVWETYRAAAGGTTARGRLPDDAAMRAELVAERTARWEAERRRPENRSEVCRSEIVSAFRAGAWLDQIDQLRAEPRVQGLEGEFACMLVVRRHVAAPHRLEVHALKTCVSAPELSDYEFGRPAGVDFVWLGVPDALTELAARRVPHMVGVLALSRKRALVTVRPAKRRAVAAELRVELLAGLLARAYVWP